MRLSTRAGLCALTKGAQRSRTACHSASVSPVPILLLATQKPRTLAGVIRSATE
jgi:hypothetical protein